MVSASAGRRSKRSARAARSATPRGSSGVTPDLPRGAADLAGRPERFDRLAADADAIKAYVRKFAEA